MTDPRELLAKATEGPWRIGQPYTNLLRILSERGVKQVAELFTDLPKENAALIVWLRNNAEAMLDLIEQADVHIRDHLALLDSAKIDFPVTKIALKHWCAERARILGVKDEKAD